MSVASVPFHTSYDAFAAYALAEHMHVSKIHNEKESKFFCIQLIITKSAAKVRKKNDIHKSVCHFLEKFGSLALRVCLVVLASADVPQIRFPGLLAVRQVLLCGVVRLVGRDGGEVLRTRFDEAAYLRETLTSHELVLRHRSGALVLAYRVQTRTIGALRLCHAVRRQQARAVR